MIYQFVAIDKQEKLFTIILGVTGAVDMYLQINQVTKNLAVILDKCKH